MHKYFLTLIIPLLLLPLSTNAQENEIEFYTLEEATKSLQQHYGNHRKCIIPNRFICDLLVPNIMYPSYAKDVPLTPYSSVANLDKILEFHMPYIETTVNYDFVSYRSHTTNTEIQKGILEYSSYDNWQDYLKNEYKNRYTARLQEVLGQYSAGFIQIHNSEALNAWSNIKGEYISSTFFPFFDRLNTSPITQSKAEELLGGEVVLVKSFGSLYLENENQVLHTPHKIDHFIWVQADKAIGLISGKNYQIVDELEQPLNLLTDTVETRITEETIAGTDIETFKIQVMFDLIPVEN